MMKEQLYKIWRRCAPPFFRYPQKTSGGADTRPPPAGARVLNIYLSTSAPKSQSQVNKYSLHDEKVTLNVFKTI